MFNGEFRMTKNPFSAIGAIWAFGIGHSFEDSGLGDSLSGNLSIRECCANKKRRSDHATGPPQAGYQINVAGVAG
jgi:hypothetical protein